MKRIMCIMISFMLASFGCLLLQSNIGFAYEPMGDNYNDVDSNTADNDSTPDVGTETLFVNAQDTTPDADYMNIQEADTGSAGGNEWLDCDAWDNSFSGAPWTRVGTQPYLSSQNEPTDYISTKTDGNDEGWFDFPSTTLTGTLTVNISIYCKNNDGVNDDYADVYIDYTGGGSGSDVGDVAQHTTYSYDTISLGSHTISEVNNLRVYFNYVKSKGADDVYIDHVRIGVSSTPSTNYDMDFEYDWSNVNYNEINKEVCFYVQNVPASEDLNVSYWSGSLWIKLGEMLQQ